MIWRHTALICVLFMVSSLALWALSHEAHAQTPSIQPAFGIVRPLAIHAVSCRLLPILPINRPDCERERVLRQRERYFSVAQGTQIDIVARQLESLDGSFGLPSDMIRLAAVPLDPNGNVKRPVPVIDRTRSVGTAEAEAESQEAPTQPEGIAPAGADFTGRVNPAANSPLRFDELPRIVRVRPGQGEVLEVRVDVKTIPSGEYRGVLTAQVIDQDNGGKVIPVPITLRVKDYFVLPLAILLIGIIVGLWVSSYVSRKKDVDELVIQSDQLQRQVEIEPHFHENFRAQIENRLRNVLFDLRRNEVDQARQNLNSSFTLWDKWRMRPREWVKLFDDFHSRFEQIDQILSGSDNDRRLMRLRDELREIQQSTTNEDVKYEDLSSRLMAVIEQIEWFASAHAELTTIGQNLEKLEQQERDAFDQNFAQLQQDFTQLSIDDGEAFQAFTEAVSTLRSELRSSFRDMNRDDEWTTSPPVASPEHRRLINSESGSSLRPVGQLVEAAQWTTAAARSRFRMGSRSARSALWRRNAFNITGYTVLMVILAGSGFNELYAQNTVFGADGFSDYMTLFAWGFGAEASRSSFAQLMSSWGHPAGARSA